MRFKMRFETEDAAERRYMGIITGISDVDPIRWPGSKWRCLMVRWEWDDAEITRHYRVSPWEIEPSITVSGGSSQVSPGTKRSRISFPTTEQDFPVPKVLTDGTGMSDFGESSRFQVLQGQEILGFHASYDGIEAQKHHPPELMRGRFPGSIGSWASELGNGVRNHSCFDNSERFLGKLTSSLPCERSSPGMESQQGRASLGLLKERRQLGFSNLPPDLVWTRKSSCKLFGFPLTEGSPGIYKEGNPTVVKSPCAPKSCLLPRVEEQLN